MTKKTETTVDQLDKKLRDLLAVSGRDRRSMMVNSFLRGIAQGFGAIIGGTILVALLIWIFTLFEQVPLLGPAFDTISETIDSN